MEYVAMYRGRRVNDMSKDELIAALSEVAWQLHVEREITHAKLISEVAYRAEMARQAVA
jgi:hypothetical protein